MAESWMYNAFPLKRADQTTRGDDYQYVIQSLDAALRHTFGFPAGVAITPPFSINAAGDVEILQSMTIGSDVPITEIVDIIPLIAGEDDDSQIANVTSIRAFTSNYMTDYLSTQDVFVLRAGDTMTGALIAEGGITAASELAISNAVFATNAMLGIGMALQAYGGIDLAKYQDAVVIGSLTETLLLTGSGGRPQYKGENVALVSDIAGSIPGMDYVPEAGGTFAGLVNFGGGLNVVFGNSIDMEYNAGVSSFTLVQVGTDALGDVVFDAGNGRFEMQGAVLVDVIDLNVGARENVLAFSSGEVQVGHDSVPINLLGSGTRPEYMGGELALLTDAQGTYQAGLGITFTDVGGDVDEISISDNGIVIAHMPAGGANGQYSRISALGVLEWSDLDIVAGTGMVVTTHGTTKQVTLDINDLGVDTAQIADEAVTTAKLGIDSVDFEQINAVRTIPIANEGLYTLIVDADGAGGAELQWQKGGSAGVLGTIDRLEVSSIGNSSDSTDVVALAGTTGPYMIHFVELEDLVFGRNGLLTITIDGQTIPIFDEEVITYQDPTVIANDAAALYDFPFFAKESFEIKFKLSGSAGTIKCSAKAVVMG